MTTLLNLSVPFLCVAVAFYFIGWFRGHFKGCRETEARWTKSFKRNYDGALEGKLVIEDPLDIPEFLRKKNDEQILCANGCIMVNGECFVDDPYARTPEGHRIFADHVKKGMKVTIT